MNMRISFCNNKLYPNNSCQLSNFKGKGLDFINAWFENDYSPIVSEISESKLYYDTVRDISEGAKLYFEKNKEVDNVVQDFHTNGGLTAFFDIPDGKILKFSLANPLEYREHNPEFDIPFLTPVEKYGKTYVVIQPKADTDNITREHFLDVAKRIYQNRCELSAEGKKYEQYGLYKGKPYLIDTRCAIPLPNAWSIIIDEICKKLNKCYTRINIKQHKAMLESEYKQKGYSVYHSDAKPRENLTFIGGLAKIFIVIINNIKYRKNNYCMPYEVARSKKIPLRILY